MEVFLMGLEKCVINFNECQFHVCLYCQAHKGSD